MDVNYSTITLHKIDDNNPLSGLPNTVNSAFPSIETRSNKNFCYCKSLTTQVQIPLSQSLPNRVESAIKHQSNYSCFTQDTITKYLPIIKDRNAYNDFTIERLLLNHNLPKIITNTTNYDLEKQKIDDRNHYFHQNDHHVKSVDSLETMFSLTHGGSSYQLWRHMNDDHENLSEDI